MILVVDDEPDLREVVADILADEDYPVATARDGQEALDIIEASPPALLVSDVTMPRMDGISLVRRLRERGLDIPVMLVTARPLWVDLPGVNVLPKPFTLDDLLDAVAQCLEAGR